MLGGHAAAPCNTHGLSACLSSPWASPPFGHIADASMSEEQLDAMKLDYIANRSERGREAVEKLWEERREKLLKMSGRKDNNPNFPR